MLLLLLLPFLQRWCLVDKQAVAGHALIVEAPLCCAATMLWPCCHEWGGGATPSPLREHCSACNPCRLVPWNALASGCLLGAACRQA
jgi:hypothetical protein